MKKNLLVFATSISLLAACSCPNSSSNNKMDQGKHFKFSGKNRLIPPTDESIPLDSANKMLLSYLNSINYHTNDSDLHSITIDATQLRSYLSNTNITHVKLMFAHTLDYINAGGKDIPAGYNSGALTIILACYDSSGNYVYKNMGTEHAVLDYGVPCPYNCLITGTAAIDTFLIVR